MGKHSPTPWRYQCEITTGFGLPSSKKFEVYKDGGEFGHPATCDLEANAELICRAVNAHDALVEALKAYHRTAQSIPYAQWSPEMHQAETALKLAGAL